MQQRREDRTRAATAEAAVEALKAIESAAMRLDAIRTRVALAATGPWFWDHCYELAAGRGGVERHWALKNSISKADGKVISAKLVLTATSPVDFDGRPFDSDANLQLIANAPADLTYLLEQLERQAEQLAAFQKHREPARERESR